MELRAALFEAAQSGEPVNVVPLPVEMNQHMLISMRAAPAQDLAPGLMVVFIDAQTSTIEGQPQRTEAVVSGMPNVTHLDLELDRLKYHLRETVEQYESSYEELKSRNEE